MLEWAVIHAKPKIPGELTWEEVFDFLFSEGRDDPATQKLERKLNRLVRELLRPPSPIKKCSR